MSIKNNTTSLQNLLDAVNALPEAGGSGIELPELTNEGAASDLISGKQLIDDEGNIVTGTFSIDNELNTQDDLIAQIQAAVDNLPEAGDGEPTLQSKTVTPGTSSQTVTADSGYDGLNTVTVNAIPSTYVEPTSTKSATTYTPTTSNQTIPAGTYCSGTQTIKGDANLIPANIVSGKSIFGVVGSAEVGGGSGGGNTETATVTIVVDAPVGHGTEKIYYESSNGVSEIALIDYELNSVSISCKVPSIVSVYMASLMCSGNIEKLYSGAGTSAFYITGNGTLRFI